MTIDPEIAECIEINHVTGKSRIKEGVPKEKALNLNDSRLLFYLKIFTF